MRKNAFHELGEPSDNTAFREYANLVDSIRRNTRARGPARVPYGSRDRIRLGAADLTCHALQLEGWEHGRARSACAINCGRPQPAVYIGCQSNTAPLSAKLAEPQPACSWPADPCRMRTFPGRPHAPLTRVVSLFLPRLCDRMNALICAHNNRLTGGLARITVTPKQLSKQMFMGSGQKVKRDSRGGLIFTRNLNEPGEFEVG